MKRRKFYALGRSRFCYYFAKYASLMDLLAFFGGMGSSEKNWRKSPKHWGKMAEIRWKKKGTSPTYKRRNKNNNFPTRLNVSNISTRPPTPQKKRIVYIIRTIEQIFLNLCPPKKTRNQSGQLPILSPHPRIYSLKLTAKAPENGCLEDAPFSGAIFVSFR